MIKEMKINQRGFSLVEVLVVVGLMGALMLGLTQVIINLQQESRAVAEKMAFIDLARVMNSTLALGPTCSNIVSNPAWNTNAPYTINPASLATTSFVVPDLRSGPDPSTIFAQAGSPASSLSNTAIVDQIRLENFTSNGPNSYSADITVTPRNSQLVRSIKPISMRIPVSTNALNEIVGCGPPPSSMITTGVSVCPCGHGSTCTVVITHGLNKMVIAGAATLRDLASGRNAHGAAIVAQDLNSFTIRCAGQPFGFYNQINWWYYSL